MAEVYGDESPMAAVSKALYGLMLRQAGRPREAVAVQEAALSIWEAKLGTKHVETGRTRFNLAELHAELDGLSARAESLYRSAIETAEAALGKNSNPAFFMKMAYARQLMSASRSQEAIDLLMAPDTVTTFTLTGPNNRSDFLALLKEVVRVVFLRLESLGVRCRASVIARPRY